MPVHQHNKEEIVDRLVSNFQSSYLSLISIIQGVAFGIWATNVNTTFFVNATSFWLLVDPFLSLVGIIIVFYCYSWFVSFVFAKPDLRESVIPFILGTTQVFPMFFFDNPKYWWLGFSFFSLAGAMAFRNTIHTLKSRTYDQECAKIPFYIKKQMNINISMCCLASYISTLAYVYICFNPSVSKSLEVGHILFFSLILVPTFILLYTTQRHFLNRMYNLLGLENKTAGQDTNSGT